MFSISLRTGRSERLPPGSAAAKIILIVFGLLGFLPEYVELKGQLSDLRQVAFFPDVPRVNP